MTIRYKIHQQGNDTVLAAADQSCLGIKHADPPARAASPSGHSSAPPPKPRRVLDLITFRSFYDGETADEAQLAALLSSATSANLVGERAIAIALKSGMARPEHVVRIGEVPHLQIYRIPKENE